MLATEEQLVEVWIMEQLVDAGFDGDQVARLLRTIDEDPEAWRRAVKYVRDGCDPALAVRIVV